MRGTADSKKQTNSSWNWFDYFGFLPRCSFYSWSRVSVARDRPSRAKDFELTRVRIGRSIIMYETRCRGGEDAWFHLPIANRNRKPAQNRNDRYILRRSGRIEPAAYSSPARFKIVPMHIQSYSVHSALRDPRSVSHREFRPLNISRILPSPRFYYAYPRFRFYLDFIIYTLDMCVVRTVQPILHQKYVFNQVFL